LTLSASTDCSVNANESCLSAFGDAGPTGASGLQGDRHRCVSNDRVYDSQAACIHATCLSPACPCANDRPCLVCCVSAAASLWRRLTSITKEAGQPLHGMPVLTDMPMLTVRLLSTLKWNFPCRSSGSGRGNWCNGAYRTYRLWYHCTVTSCFATASGVPAFLAGCARCPLPSTTTTTCDWQMGKWANCVLTDHL
jgi:hypothetical protein